MGRKRAREDDGGGDVGVNGTCSNKSLKVRTEDDQQQGHGYPHIPADIMIDIILRFPPKSISRFRCVNKEWYSLFQGESFKDVYCHLRRQNSNTLHIFGTKSKDLRYRLYSIDRQSGVTTESFPLNFYSPGERGPTVASYNGLFCVRTCDRGLVLWNPTTSESIHLPKPKFFFPNRPCILQTSNVLKCPHIGFGFDGVSKKFKVIGCNRYIRRDSIDVLTVGDNVWRTVRGGSIYTPDLMDKVICINGSMYWISMVERVPGELCRISSFNLSTETFGEISPPSDGFVYLGHWLCEFEGSLCLAARNHKLLDLWVLLTTPDGGQQTWINQRITLPFEHSPELHEAIMPIQNGEILVQCAQENCFYLCHYDPQQSHQLLKTIKVTGPPMSLVMAGKQDESLVVLKDYM